jgi:hypothetical protein
MKGGEASLAEKQGKFTHPRVLILTARYYFRDKRSCFPRIYKDWNRESRSQNLKNRPKNEGERGERSDSPRGCNRKCRFINGLLFRIVPPVNSPGTGTARRDMAGFFKTLNKNWHVQKLCLLLEQNQRIIDEQMQSAQELKKGALRLFPLRSGHLVPYRMRERAARML